MKKNYQIALFVISCILLNYVGKEFASALSLPVWLDSAGTILTAYELGPACGAIVGVTVNIIYGMGNPVSLIYGITSILIGVSIGIAAKRKFFDSIFGTLIVSVVVTLLSVIVSTPLNMIFADGYTQNIWGDGVVGFLMEAGVPKVLCCFAGEFYIDFVDKTLMLMLLYLAKNLAARWQKRKLAEMLLPFVLLCLLGRPAEAAAASVNEYSSCVQTVYNAANGLPCGEANDIVQTSDGILWIGTYAGLYRYNGSEFRWMNEYESIKNVNCMYVDEEGRLWVGTNDNGVSVLINDTIANVVDTGNGLVSDSVRSVVQGSDGLYYVGTSDSLQMITLRGGLKVLEEVPSIKYASSLSSDGREYVAAVTAAGELFLLKNGQVEYQTAYETGKGKYVSCAFDKYGILYVGTSEGEIVAYEIEKGAPKLHGRIRCKELHIINRLYFSEEGRLFICADNGAGYVNDDSVFFQINTGEFNNAIDHALVDYQGNIWFCSYRQGVLRMCPSDFTNHYDVTGVAHKVVNSSCMWNGLLYVATDSGLDVLDLENYSTVENSLTKQLEGLRIRCIRVDSDNHLWICTYGQGLWEVDDSHIRTYSTKNNTFGDWARTVIELSDKTIVAAGDQGLSYIQNGEIVRSFPYGEELGNAIILSLMEWRDGEVVVGSDGDGMAVIQDGKIVRKITKENGLGSGVILRTVKDRGGTGVFVVGSNGLYYMEEDYTVRELENFPYYNNYDLVESEDGKIFVTGSAGIYVVYRDALFSGQTPEYELLNARSGLDSALTANSWNYLDDDGNWYLSGDSGVYSFNINRYGACERSFRMTVASVKLDDVLYNVERGSSIEIGRDVNKIEIFPEVINYTLENPYVSYYLEGFDLSPTVMPQSDLTSVVYTNVPSGQYRFFISVLDSKTGTALEESEYLLEKEMEIYDHSWFKAYMLIVLLLVVAWISWFVVRTRIQRTITLQRKELELARAQVEMGNQAILAIAKTVDAKDGRTSKHSQRVSEYAVLIAQELGMDEEQCENLRKTALLHDIGKIGIPDYILNKPDQLTPEEYQVMKSHVTSGAAILKDFTMVDHVWEGALYHHERYDGTGYNEGLKGEEIPLNARIVGIADTFDAMTANRVYRKKMDIQVVLDEIARGRGTQFDPHLVDVLLKLIDEGKINLQAIYQRQE